MQLMKYNNTMLPMEESKFYHICHIYIHYIYRSVMREWITSTKVQCAKCDRPKSNEQTFF